VLATTRALRVWWTNGITLRSPAARALGRPSSSPREVAPRHVETLAFYSTFRGFLTAAARQHPDSRGGMVPVGSAREDSVRAAQLIAPQLLGAPSPPRVPIEPYPCGCRAQNFAIFGLHGAAGRAGSRWKRVWPRRNRCWMRRRDRRTLRRHGGRSRLRSSPSLLDPRREAARGLAGPGRQHVTRWERPTYWRSILSIPPRAHGGFPGSGARMPGPSSPFWPARREPPARRAIRGCPVRAIGARKTTSCPASPRRNPPCWSKGRPERAPPGSRFWQLGLRVLVDGRGLEKRKEAEGSRAEALTFFPPPPGALKPGCRKAAWPDSVDGSGETCRPSCRACATAGSPSPIQHAFLFLAVQLNAPPRARPSPRHSHGTCSRAWGITSMPSASSRGGPNRPNAFPSALPQRQRSACPAACAERAPRRGAGPHIREGRCALRADWTPPIEWRRRWCFANDHTPNPNTPICVDSPYLFGEVVTGLRRASVSVRRRQVTWYALFNTRELLPCASAAISGGNTVRSGASRCGRRDGGRYRAAPAPACGAGPEPGRPGPLNPGARKTRNVRAGLPADS